jgi:hypothetical protein
MMARRAAHGARSCASPLRALAPALGVIALFGTALAHPFEMDPPEPTSYATAVHRMGDELHEIRLARESGGIARIAPRAAHIVTLAARVPGFTMTLSTALQDSAVGRVLQAALRMETAASALQRAAENSDLEAVTVHAQRCDEALRFLDAFVPRQYVCPMQCEPGRTYDHAGACPVCGMTLQWITSDHYTVEVRPTGGSLQARVKQTLHFQLRDPSGFKVESLLIVHEKPLHLLMVSQDLSWFAHEHPIPGPMGSFELPFAFPAGGRYVLYHDFTPDSSGMQVVPVQLDVEGPEPPPVPLVVDQVPTKRINGCEVTLSHTPLTPDTECTLSFTITRHGKPVMDLEPFLGAAGHLIVISQDLGVFVHSHPLAMSSGPVLEFKARFTRTGLYKAWGQFRHHGQVLTVPFVVEVAEESPSPSTEKATRVVR